MTAQRLHELAAGEGWSSDACPTNVENAERETTPVSRRQYCAFHADEDIAGEVLDEDGTLSFTCDRSRGHPVPGPYTWMQAPAPPDLPELSGLAEELGLRTELPAAVARHRGQWVEYGVVEATYAEMNPADFARLVARYGHTSLEATRYSASSFLAATLGRLSRSGEVLFSYGPATGRWSYNGRISWWAVPPPPPKESRLSWADLGRDMSYVPGRGDT